MFTIVWIVGQTFGVADSQGVIFRGTKRQCVNFVEKQGYMPISDYDHWNEEAANRKLRSDLREVFEGLDAALGRSYIR